MFPQLLYLDMTPVMSNSINNILLIHVTPFTTRKTQCLKRCNLLRISAKQTRSSQKFILPLSTSVRLLSQSRSGLFLQLKSRTDITCATGTETDVTIEEADSPVADEDSGATSEISTDAVGRSEELRVKLDPSVLSAQRKHLRPARKSEMPLVNPEELIPGAMFTGKVMSITSFGVFVDFGAFTNGLVHISQLIDGFVKNVGDIVSVGQEVKVKLVEANMETRRISLTMREIDGTSNMQKRKDSPASSEKGRPPRNGTPRSNQKRADGNQPFSKFETGQDFVGTVKNLNISGAFISLPDGEEGFLPLEEEVTDGFGDFDNGRSSLEVGQEVSVRVLRIARSQVTLTMKREEDEAVGELDVEVFHGVIHKATNSFMLAFRKDKDIAAFLDEREKKAEPTGNSRIPQTPDDLEGKASLIKTDLNSVQDQQTSSSESDKIEGKFDLSGIGVDEVQDHQESDSNRLVSTLTEEDETSSKEVDVKASIVDASNEQVNDIKDPEIIIFESSDGINEAVIEEVTESRSEILVPQESASASDQPSEKSPAVDPSSSKNQVNQEVSQFSLSPENIVSDSLQSLDNVATSIEEKAEGTFDVMSSESDGSSVGEVSTADGLKNTGKVDLSAQITAISEEIVSVSDQLTEEAPAVDQRSSVNQAGEEVGQLANNGGLQENTIFDSLQSVDSVAVDSVAGSLEEKLVASTKVLSPKGDGSSFDEVSTTDGLENEREENLSLQKNDSITLDSAISEEVTEIRADNAIASDEVQMTKPNAAIELISAIVVEEVGINPDNNESITSSNDQVDVPAVHQIMNEATCISPALVKQLRDETGAAMMDCKKALSETGVDLVKAQEFLRKKGLTNAAKKANRSTAEGRIGAYVHNSQIGVLIEVNCETDFVSRGEIFTELVDDLAMQVAACPQVQYLVTDDVPTETVEKEREIEMQKEDLLSKPEQMRSRIVDGRIRKRVEKMALLEQPYIKNDKLAVKDWVKQTIATVGENIKVKRFVRFNLGEGLEKKSQDFAAEVAAAQTAAKSVPEKVQPAVVETVYKAPNVTVSAALVKHLREETSAGMMDCKKALSETGGDLDKAQEYLRKKGLSTADKKSSRLAAEGRIGSCIHDSRTGVLIEVNIETDFAGRAEKFKELVDDLSMQVVACPQVQYVSIQDIPEDIKERIVKARISKSLEELALLEQPFVKNDSILVKDLVKQTVAALGENIKVRRFVRFTLGETNETAEMANEAWNADETDKREDS